MSNMTKRFQYVRPFVGKNAEGTTWKYFVNVFFWYYDVIFTFHMNNECLNKPFKLLFFSSSIL